jgi:hypothetical protein
VTTKLDEMWAAFEAHKPAPEYADAWATMCKERTYEAVEAAYRAAPIKSAAGLAALSAGAAMLSAAALWPLTPTLADRHTQDAIDAIKEVKP